MDANWPGDTRPLYVRALESREIEQALATREDDPPRPGSRRGVRTPTLDASSLDEQLAKAREASPTSVLGAARRGRS